MDCKSFSIIELKDAFFLLKINKSSGLDDVSFNIIRKIIWGGLQTFNLSILATSWKGNISSWFNNSKSNSNLVVVISGNNSDISNYTLRLVLPCFSKAFARFMYNGLYKCLK